MSQFAAELETVKVERQINAAEICRITGVEQAVLSRVKNGAQNITFDELERVCLAFAIAPVYQARLLRARLLDECHRPGGKLLSIEIKGEPGTAELRETAPGYTASLPPAHARAIQKIVNHMPKDARLRNVVLFMAERLA